MVQRYEFYFQVVKTVLFLQMSTEKTSKMFFFYYIDILDFKNTGQVC